MTCKFCYEQVGHKSWCNLHDPSLDWGIGLFHMMDTLPLAENGSVAWVSIGEGQSRKYVRTLSVWREADPPEARYVQQ